jgi:hypothetical protein
MTAEFLAKNENFSFGFIHEILPGLKMHQWSAKITAAIISVVGITVPFYIGWRVQQQAQAYSTEVENGIHLTKIRI